ncbi:MAG: DUF4932 domain-containing protein [Oscillospiraceae bacterium]|nr:DUF4932 domain-containing protein [Oscillospiraceae bacterium]
MNITFDKRIELLLGLQYCVERDEPGRIYPDGKFFYDTLPSYCEEFYERYEKAADREFKEYIAAGGLDTYNRTIEIAFALDESYHIRDTEEIAHIEKRTPQFNKGFLEEKLREFVKASDFESFWESKRELLDRAAEAYRTALCTKAEFDERTFFDFYGYELGKLRVILYNYALGGYGMKSGKFVVTLQGFRNAGENENNIKVKSSCIITCLHEFSHPYMNPLGEKYFANADLTDFYRQAKENGLDSCYNNPVVLINEYMVRAVQFYLGRKYLDPEDIVPMVEWHKTGMGYCHIEEVMALFDLRAKYRSFEEFYKNEVVGYFAKFGRI